jgi:uncharacterized repeat protein (TIGR01451 family)
MHFSRVKKFAMLLIIFSIISVTLSPISASDGLANSSWPKEGHDINNTGQSQYIGAQTNQTNWTFNTSSSIQGSTIIGADGTIYFSDTDTFHALYPNGTEKWNFSRVSKLPYSAAVDKNGIIYLGCCGEFTSAVLYALYPNGTVKWNISGAASTDIENAPTISSDGTIYFSMADKDQTNTYLYSVNPDSTINWMFPLYTDPANLGVVPTTCPAIGPDGTIYLTTQIMDGTSQNDSNLFAINPNGTLKWKYNFYLSSQSSPVIGKDGTIYFGADSEGSTAYFYAINPDGKQKWNFTTGNSISTSPALASDGTIYFGSFDGFFYALNPDGTLKWKFNTSEMKDGTASTSPVIGSDGTIYFGCFSNDFGRSYFYALNPDGTVKWRYLAKGTIESNPAIAKDGTLYFGSAWTVLESVRGVFYAIKCQISDIYVKTSADKTNPKVGDKVTLTFKVGNNGPDIAYNTVMNFIIPAGMKFLSASADMGTWSFNTATNTITWDLGDLAVCDPTLTVLTEIIKSGKYVIQPVLSTSSYDPNLVNSVQTIVVNAQTKSTGHVNTIGLRETGVPVNYIIIGILMVLSGLLVPRRK